ncbi:MAG: zinc ribbon domain-containing protein [Bacilli bacterium]
MGKVPFAYSSQECAACGCTHSDNRPTQAEFVCRRCGHTDGANHNAAVVIARRGVTKFLSGVPLTKPKKTVRMRKTVGPERSQPVQPAQKSEETD